MCRHIDTIFTDLRDDLLNDDVHDKDDNKVRNVRCPEVRIRLNNVEVTALIDSASKVDAISEQWYCYNKEKLGHQTSYV